MASSARHLFLPAFVVAVLAVATPRVAAWGGGRLFFSKTMRPEAAVDDPGKKAAAVQPASAADPYSAAAFSRPSTGGSGRGYGLYGRPEENFPPDYFRRGVHRNTEKLTTTGTEEAVPVGGRRERAEAEPSAEDNGSGRGRAPWTNSDLHVPATTSTEKTVPGTAGGGEQRSDPLAEDNGSGWGRPPRYNGRAGDGAPEELRNYYGMSDTRLYQNGRYYYDVDARRYGYGRESNPVRTRPGEQFAGDDRRGRYGSAAAGYQYGNGNELGNGFQEEAQNGRYIP